MRDLEDKAKRKLKNIDTLFDIAEILARNKTIDVTEIKGLVMLAIISLVNLFENFKEGER